MSKIRKDIEDIKEYIKKNYEKNPFQTDLKNFSPYLEKILQVLMRLKVLAKGC